MTRFFLFVCCMLSIFACSKTDPAPVSEAVIAFSPDLGPEATLNLLKQINALEDDSIRTSLFEVVWTKLVDADQIPMKSGENVLFLYRGDAHNVRWNGAFNNWGKGKAILGTRLFKLGLWYAQASFNADARLEYKIVLNTTNWFTKFFGWKTEWIFDPANPHRRPGGFGPDSELIMPGYKPHPETAVRDSIQKGTLSEPELVASLKLGYPVRYQVYLPAELPKKARFPVIYVTDGHEYASDDMGKMVTVLDNCIADGSIPPVIAVFIDPRDTATGENKRMDQFALNKEFAAFLAEEIVLLIDAKYPTIAKPDARALMGTSLGGLNAAFVGHSYPGVFGNLAIHSPAFWYKEQILDLYKSSDRLPLRIYMASGTVNDTEEHARKMREILMEKAYPLEYIEFNESHSWGMWSGLIDDPIRYFWGSKKRSAS